MVTRIFREDIGFIGYLLNEWPFIWSRLNTGWLMQSSSNFMGIMDSRLIHWFIIVNLTVSRVTHILSSSVRFILNGVSMLTRSHVHTFRVLLDNTLNYVMSWELYSFAQMESHHNLHFHKCSSSLLISRTYFLSQIGDIRRLNLCICGRR